MPPRRIGSPAPVAKEFVAKASTKKLHPKVREFLNVRSSEKVLWVGEHVTHSNVASRDLTVVGVASATTSTAFTQPPAILTPPAKKSD
jgi:hypothetical protein